MSEITVAEILSKYHRGFHKGFNAQYCLVNMVKKKKKISVDNVGVLSAPMTNCSTGFYCLHHKY